MSTTTAQSVGVISVRIVGVLLLFITALSWLSVLVSPAQETLTAALTLSFLCGVLLAAAYVWGEYI